MILNWDFEKQQSELINDHIHDALVQLGNVNLLFVKVTNTLIFNQMSIIQIAFDAMTKFFLDSRNDMTMRSVALSALGNVSINHIAVMNLYY